MTVIISSSKDTLLILAESAAVYNLARVIQHPVNPLITLLFLWCLISCRECGSEVP